MNKKILVVGVGGIGFRHFQALFNCEEKIEIYVLDICDDAIRRAKEYGDSLNSGVNVFYLQNISDVPEYVDVAIIATSSLPRRRIFENLVEKHQVDKIIFEKFLFPRMEDYDCVERIIKERKIEAYVDCAARIYDFYNEIKERMKNFKFFTASIRGGNWGLACNAIHMLHLIAYLSGEDEKKVNCIGLLENNIFKSKRNGYMEFFGKIIGSFGENVSFSIECDHSDAPLVYDFFTDENYFCVKQGEEIYSAISLNRLNEIETKDADFLFISQITNRNIDCLLRGEGAFLPKYSESRPLHESLLKVFMEHCEKVENKKMDLCPIT